MLPEEYDVLTEMLKELKQEIADLEICMGANLRRIREAEAYIGTLAVSEPEDFKVFSPRRAETVHKEELRQAQECRLACQRENEELTERKTLLNGRIRRLEELLRHLEHAAQPKMKEAGDFQAKALRSLKELAERIDESSAYMERNPVQARQNFAIIGRCLRELAERIEDTVWLERDSKASSGAGWEPHQED